MKISELKTGEEAKILCYMVKERIEKNSNIYLKLKFNDKNDSLTTCIFDKHNLFSTIDTEFAVSELVDVGLTLTGVNAKGFKEVIVNSIEKKTAPDTINCVPIKELKKELWTILKSFKKDIRLAELVVNVFKRDDVKDLYFTAPLTINGAYSYKGGILAQTIRLCRLIDVVVPIYDNWNFDTSSKTTLNIDMLKMAAILNGVGTSLSLEYKDNQVVKTFLGELSDSQTLTSNIITEELNKMEFTEVEKILIKHILETAKSLSGFKPVNVARTSDAMIFATLKKMDTAIGTIEYLKKTSLGNSEFSRLFEKNYCLIDFPTFENVEE